MCVCVCVCVCVWVCALSRVTPHPPHTFYSLTQDSKEKRRAEKRREERSRDERCWHKMLTCQHWLRERDMGRGNRGSDRRWQNEQITMTKGFDWNWRATGRRGILEDGSGSKVGGGGWGWWWEERWHWCRLRSFTWPLCNSTTGALPLCLSLSPIHNCLPAFPLSFATRGHTLNGVKIKTPFRGGFQCAFTQLERRGWVHAHPSTRYHTVVHSGCN